MLGNPTPAPDELGATYHEITDALDYQAVARGLQLGGVWFSPEEYAALGDPERSYAGKGDLIDGALERWEQAGMPEPESDPDRQINPQLDRLRRPDLLPRTLPRTPGACQTCGGSGIVRIVGGGTAPCPRGCDPTILR